MIIVIQLNTVTQKFPLFQGLFALHSSIYIASNNIRCVISSYALIIQADWTIIVGPGIIVAPGIITGP